MAQAGITGRPCAITVGVPANERIIIKLSVTLPSRPAGRGEEATTVSSLTAGLRACLAKAGQDQLKLGTAGCRSSRKFYFHSLS